MTTLEHLEAIQEECEKRLNCEGCPYFVKVTSLFEAPKHEMYCLYALAFGDAPYEWNLENLGGVLKEY